MKHHSLLILTLLAASVLYADAPQRYARIRIAVPDRALLTRIWSAGVDFEGLSGKPGGQMEFVAGPEELRRLTADGISFTTIQEDLSAKALEGLRPGPVNALGFGFGSMGGYYTFAEVLRQLDSMKLQYPNLVRTRENIGVTGEGRALWAVKISDNPNTEEASEPEALYTALHHAREPEGMMTVLYYMWWLLEQYGTDSLATYLVNTRQLWFIPVVNPDGYVYNETTNPSGGGFWRKNRRPNAGGSFGVDLNRNYGPSEMWNSPNGGSSTAASSDTYRGTAPFSEPEPMALAEFLANHAVKTCLNYHTFGNYLIYPWGYLSQENDDSLTYREFAFDMVRTNRHNSGTDLQTVSYSTRGNSDDYMYGDLTKPQTYAMTPEVGNSFWPATSEILPLAQKNLEANIYYALVAGQLTVLSHLTVLDENDDGALMRGESFSLQALLRNKGLGDAAGLQASISSASPAISFTTSTASMATLAARSEGAVTFSGSVSPFCPLGVPVDLYITLRTPDGYVHRDTATVTIGPPIPLLTDSGEIGMPKWTAGAGWGTTGSAHTPPLGYTDSPAGGYGAFAENALTTAAPFSLEGYGRAVLKFWTNWAIEPSWDVAVMEASTNGGVSWIPLRSRFSHASSGLGKQAGISWGYDGYTPGMDWVEEEVDLAPFLGDAQVLLRFRVSSDGGDERDGWYLDDIRVLAYSTSVQFSAITARDQGSGWAQLSFGESLFASDGLDPLLQETDLGPKPAEGIFDARWAIASTNGTLLDMRDTVASPSSTNVFTLEFQPGPGGYPFTFTWDPRGFLPGGWHLRDGLTHGGLFDISMWGDTLLTLSDPSVHSVEIVHAFADSITCGIAAGWNIVSLTVVTPSPYKAVLFPSALSPAFAYQGTYVTRETLTTGAGYWLKYPSPAFLKSWGIPVVQETLLVPAGWSLAGGVSVPLRDDQIARDPASSIFTYTSGKYHLLGPSSGPILPGQGFWIKGPTTAILSPFASPGQALVGSELPALPNTLTLSDAAGNASDLTFGVRSEDRSSAPFPELPPTAPPGTFDARFASQRSAELFSIGGGTQSAEILLQAGAYPVTVRWRIPASSAVYAIESQSERGMTVRRPIAGEGALALDGPPRTLRLIASGGLTLPREIALSQNFPNPFNPSTTVEVMLPVPARVTLAVVNLLGEEVLSLLRQEVIPAGRFQSTIDGTSLPSGVYFYRLDAAPLNGQAEQRFTRKMLLIK